MQPLINVCMLETTLFHTRLDQSGALILESFPWANITPTLRKLLAHSEELLSEVNSGFGFNRTRPANIWDIFLAEK